MDALAYSNFPTVTAQLLREFWGKETASLAAIAAFREIRVISHSLDNGKGMKPYAEAILESDVRNYDAFATEMIQKWGSYGFSASYWKDIRNNGPTVEEPTPCKI